MKNYFSSRISIAERRAYVGASPALRIQRLNGLSIVDRPVNKLPAVGDNTFTANYGEITMSTNSTGEYLGSTYVHDPTLNPTGISIPPAGTIGYFAKDYIPEGWLEVGNEQTFYTHKRLIAGRWEDNTQVLADTEYTAIFNLLNDWGLVRSVSKDTKGETFNTSDPFKGFFIRGLNPSNSGIDKAHSIFDATTATYLSTHRHNGVHLYDNPTINTASQKDMGFRSQLKITLDGVNQTIGSSFWFNYKWNVGLGWFVENNGTVNVDDTGYGGSPDYYAVNFANHIHGRVKTYYRGHDGLHGKLTSTYIVDGGTYYGTGDGTATGGTIFQTGSNADEQPGPEQEVTYFTPYSSAGLPAYTLYTDVTQVWQTTQTETSGQTQTLYTFARNTGTGGTNITRDYSAGVPDFTGLAADNTETSTFYNRSTETQNYRSTQEFTYLSYTRDYIRQTSEGTGEVLSNVRTVRVDYNYHPYHILKSESNTPAGSEFYNTGDNGTFIEVTTAAGSHGHSYVNSNTRKRGLGYENRPVNIALRMCIKY